MSDPRYADMPSLRKKVALQDTGLLLGIPEIHAPDYSALLREYQMVDCRKFDAAVTAFGKLNADEQDLLCLFACLRDAATPEKKSWRSRMFAALAELMKLDSSDFLYVVSVARAEGLANTPGFEPLTPFVDITPSRPTPASD